MTPAHAEDALFVITTYTTKTSNYEFGISTDRKIPSKIPYKKASFSLLSDPDKKF